MSQVNEESSATELLPCPFCGSVDINVFLAPMRDETAAAICEDCGAEGPFSLAKEEASALWNRRSAKVGAWECRRLEKIDV